MKITIDIPESLDQVTFLDDNGNELFHWTEEEWWDDACCVVPAILNCVRLALTNPDELVEIHEGIYA